MRDFAIFKAGQALSFSLQDGFGEVGFGDTQLKLLCDEHTVIDSGTTVWGVVISGQTMITTSSGTFCLKTDMVFCLPGEAHVDAEGVLFLIEQHSVERLLQIVGPVEKTGRLRYIDGCTDTLLIPPLLKGEACLNHLHFPAGIDQTMHTHSSYRLGIVLRGQGICRLKGRTVALETGCAFALDSDVEHAFKTGKESMDIIAYHPDSDYGPVHTDHPMINRTLVKGISANKLKEIQT